MKICVVMPAYNESEGIRSFLLEIEESLRALSTPSFVVIDDASTDRTAVVLNKLSAEGFPLRFKVNEVNSGHGFTTISALDAGLESESELIVAVDGDGQFRGSDIAQLVLVMKNNPLLDVVEGTRVSRRDPIYRQFTSFATRTLVWFRCRKWPKDANTPLRVYRPHALRKLLDSVNTNTEIPNLIFSALVRSWGLSLQEMPVESLKRRGSDSSGSTWGNRNEHLPTRRFITFCARSTKQWFGSRMTNQ